MPNNLSIDRNRAEEILVHIVTQGTIYDYFKAILCSIDEAQFLATITQEIERITAAKAIGEIVSFLIATVDEEQKKMLVELEEIVKKYAGELDFIIKDLKLLFLEAIETAVEGFTNDKKEQLDLENQHRWDAARQLLKEKESVKQQIEELQRKTSALSSQLKSNIEKNAWLVFCCDTLPILLSSYDIQKNKSLLLDSVAIQTNLPAYFTWLIQRIRESSVDVSMLDVNLANYVATSTDSNSQDLDTLKKIIRIHVEHPVILNTSEYTVEVSGKNIMLSELLVRPELAHDIFKTSIKIQATGIVYIDCDLDDDKWRGKNITICAPIIEIIAKHTINVSGRDAPEHENKKAKNGNAGMNGEDGEHGAAGESSGNICIKAYKIIGLDGLRIVANGGNGSAGQDGGDGGKGQSGYDGKDGHVKELAGDEIGVIDRGTHGTAGACGGNGGRAGLGGDGGFGGRIEIYQVAPPLGDDFLHFSSQVGKDRQQTEIMEMRGENGKNGANGKYGLGGEGGQSGVDGVDEGRAWLSRGWGWNGEYIHRRGQLAREFIYHRFGWDSYDLRVLRTEDDLRAKARVQSKSGAQCKEFSAKDATKTKAVSKPQINQESLAIQLYTNGSDKLFSERKVTSTCLKQELDEQRRCEQELAAKDALCKKTLEQNGEEQRHIEKKLSFFEETQKKICQLCTEKMEVVKRAHMQQARTTSRVNGYHKDDVSDIHEGDISAAVIMSGTHHDKKYDLLKSEDDAVRSLVGVSEGYKTEWFALLEQINLAIVKQNLDPKFGIELKQKIAKLLKNSRADDLKIRIAVQGLFLDFRLYLYLEVKHDQSQAKGWKWLPTMSFFGASKDTFTALIENICKKIGRNCNCLDLLFALRTKINLTMFVDINSRVTLGMEKNRDKFSQEQLQFLARLLDITNVSKIIQEWQGKASVSRIMTASSNFDNFCEELFFLLRAANINIDEYLREFEANLQELEKITPTPYEDFLEQSLGWAKKLAINGADSFLYGQAIFSAIDEGVAANVEQKFIEKFNLADATNNGVIRDFRRYYAEFDEFFASKKARSLCSRCLETILIKLNFENIPFNLDDLNRIFATLIELANINFAVSVIENNRPENWLPEIIFASLLARAKKAFVDEGEAAELITLLKSIKNKPEIIRLLNVKILELQNGQYFAIKIDEFKTIILLIQKIDFHDRTLIDIDSLNKKPLFAYKHIFETAILLEKLPLECRRFFYLDNIEKRFGLVALNMLVNIIHDSYAQTVALQEREILVNIFKKVATGKLIIGENILTLMQSRPVIAWEELLTQYVLNIKDKDLNLDELLELMRSENLYHLEDGAAFLQRLKENIGIVKRKFREKSEILSGSMPIEHDTVRVDGTIDSFTENEIKRWVINLNAEILKIHIHEALAVISRAVQIVFGFEPRDTQLIALWLFVNDINTRTNTLGQIATGEGKTLIVAMCAIFKALTGKHVDVVTSSSVLAIRDTKYVQRLFALFNLEVANNCDEECAKSEEERRKRYNHHVVYGDVGTFQSDILLGRFLQKEIRMGRACNCLILDEVDSMMVDKCHNVLYLAHQILELEALNVIFVNIWCLVNGRESVADSQAQKEEDVLVCLQELIARGKIIIPKMLQEFVKRKMEIWIKNAFAAKEIEANDPYMSRNQAICIVDKDTGVAEPMMQWENGLHQFLQLKHSQKLSLESLKAVFISNYTYFKLYDEIIGLSGTLGSHDSRSLLIELYDFKCTFNLPRAKFRFFIEEEGLICDDERKWLEQIEREVLEKCVNRAVLIICENIKYAKLVKKYLKENKDQYMIRISIVGYTKSDKKIAIGTERKPVCAGDVIVATNLAGRGTDLKIDRALESNGGICVLLTYMPANTRVKEQAFGRAARKGEWGSGKLLVCREHSSVTDLGMHFDLDDLQSYMDAQELVKLQESKTIELPCIEIQEKLLKKFEELYGRIKNILSALDKDYLQLQLDSLQNHWVFWLDQAEEQIREDYLQGNAQKQTVTAQLEKFAGEFQKFELEMIRLAASSDIFKLIISIDELHKLGMYFKKKKRFDSAISCFDRIIDADQEFSEKAYYYKAACLMEESSGQEKPAVKKQLQKAKGIMERRISWLAHSQMLLRYANQERSARGVGTNSDLYGQQVVNEIGLLKLHLNAIDEIIGIPLEPSIFLCKSCASDQKKSEELFDLLRAHQGLVKNFRISKKVFIDGDKIFIRIGTATKEIIARDPADKYSCDIFDLLKTKIGKPSFSDRLLAKQELIFDDVSADDAQILFDRLIDGGVIKQPRVAFSVQIIDDKDKIDARIEQIKKDLAGLIVRKYGAEDCQRYVADIMEAFTIAIGKLKTFPVVKISYRNMEEYLCTGAIPPEIRKFQEILFDTVIQIAEKKPWWNWSAFAVAMLGIAQIVGGVMLELCSVGFGLQVGNALISEGMNDIMFAVFAGINQNFSWKNYFENKITNLVITALCLGVGVWAKSIKDARNRAEGVVEVTQETRKYVGSIRSNPGLFIKTVAKETAKEMVVGAAKVSASLFFVNKVLDLVPELIIKNIIEKINTIINTDQSMSKALALLRRNIIELYEASYEKEQAQKIIVHLFGIVARETATSSSKLYGVIRSIVGGFSANAKDCTDSTMVAWVAKICLAGWDYGAVTHACVKVVEKLNQEIKRKVEELQVSKKVTEKTEIEREQITGFANRFAEQLKTEIMEQFAHGVRSVFIQPGIQILMNSGIERLNQKFLANKKLPLFRDVEMADAAKAGVPVSVPSLEHDNPRRAHISDAPMNDVKDDEEGAHQSLKRDSSVMSHEFDPPAKRPCK